jgi:hypothetical protein
MNVLDIVIAVNKNWSEDENVVCFRAMHHLVTTDDLIPNYLRLSTFWSWL